MFISAMLSTSGAEIKIFQVASYQVVQAFIKRLGEINPVLNAVTDERFVI